MVFSPLFHATSPPSPLSLALWRSTLYLLFCSQPNLPVLSWHFGSLPGTAWGERTINRSKHMCRGVGVSVKLTSPRIKGLAVADRVLKCETSCPLFAVFRWAYNIVWRLEQYSNSPPLLLPLPLSTLPLSLPYLPLHTPLNNIII